MSRLAAPPPPPVTSRASRATFTYAAMMLFTLVTTFTGLIITPWVIRLLGEERYGAARVLFEYAGYLSLLDLGLGGALSPLLSRALARRDSRALQGVMASGLRLYAVITAAVLIVGFSAMPWLPRLVRVQPALYGDLRWAWAFTVLGYTALVLAPFRALVDSEQRGYVSNMLLSLQALGVALASLLFAFGGLGIKGQSLATSLVVDLAALTLALITLRRHPDCLRGLRGPADPEAAAALRKLSGPTLTVNVAGRISLLSDSIIVGLILGPVRVTILFVTQRLAVIAQGQLNGVGAASWAALADLHARGEHETFNRRLVELSGLIMILGVTALGPILAFNSQFINLWLGPAFDGGDRIVVVAAINALLVGLVTQWQWVFLATGRVGLCIRPVLVSAVLNVSASVLLTRLFGTVGPLLGTAVAYLGVHAWYLPVLLRRHFGIPIRALAWAVLAPVLAGVPYAAGLWWLAKVRPAPGWIELGAEMAASAFAFLAFSVAVLLDPTDRAIWRARLLAILRLRPSRGEG